MELVRDHGAPRRGVELLSIFNVVLGLWLIGSVWALGTTNAAIARNTLACGVLVSVCGTLRFIYRGSALLSWINAAVAAWLVVSPWVFGTLGLDGETWNCTVVGVVIASIETISLTSSSLRPAGRSHVISRSPDRPEQRR